MSIFKDPKFEKEKVEEKIIENYKKEREKQIVKRYKEDRLNNQKMIKPFNEIIEEILGTDSSEDFQIKTGLSGNMFYDLKKKISAEKPCKKSTIVSVCVGYDMGIQIAYELLRSQGSMFNPHRKADSAYMMLLTEYRGKSVEECNELLEKIGIRKSDWLGVHARGHR